MKIKNKLIITFLCLINFTFSAPVPSGVIVTDLNVMQKDTQASYNTIQTYYTWIKQAQEAKNQATNGANILSTMQNINNTSIRKLCTNCSDYTISELEKYKQIMGANWCDSVSNSLDFAQKQFANAGDIQRFLDTLSSSVASGTLDPGAFMSALSTASSSTLNSLNQTTQMMAATQASEKQEQEVKNQIAKKRLDYAITGNPNSL